MKNNKLILIVVAIVILVGILCSCSGEATQPTAGITSSRNYSRIIADIPYKVTYIDKNNNLKTFSIDSGYDYFIDGEYLCVITSKTNESVVEGESVVGGEDIVTTRKPLIPADAKNIEFDALCEYTDGNYTHKMGIEKLPIKEIIYRCVVVRGNYTITREPVYVIDTENNKTIICCYQYSLASEHYTVVWCQKD